MNLLEVIGNNIKNHRKAQGLTQADLSKDIVSRGFISQLEKGAVSPSIETLEKLAKRLNCSISDIIEGDEIGGSSNNRFKVVSILDAIEAQLNENINKSIDTLLSSIKDIDTRYLNEYEFGRYSFIKASLYWEKRELLEARIHINNAIEKFSHSYEEKLGKCYNLLGKISFHSKDNFTAIGALSKAFFYSTKYYTDTKLRVETLFNFGVFHAHQKEYTSAIFYLKEAQNINNIIESYYLAGEIHMTLGICYRYQKQWNLSIEEYNNSLHIFNEKRNLSMVASLHQNCGYLYRAMKNYQESNKSFNKALSYYTKINNNLSITDIKLELIRNDILKGNYTEARLTLQNLGILTLTQKQSGFLVIFDALILITDTQTTLTILQIKGMIDEGLELLKNNTLVVENIILDIASHFEKHLLYEEALSYLNRYHLNE